MDKRNKVVGSFIGLAVGDALGASVEFASRGSFPAVTDMQAGGPWNLNLGEWTDDTIMALCMAEAIIEQNKYDPSVILEKWLQWYRNGLNSPKGYCFDIGATTSNGLSYYERHGKTNPIRHSRNAGNGGIMRLAPVAMISHSNKNQAIDYAIKQGSYTHNSQESDDCCAILSNALYNAYNELDVFSDIFQCQPSSDAHKISAATFKDKHEPEISSSGYSVDTLEAAFWCCFNTTSFSDAVLKAVNLGNDSDTVGAVTGQLAGAIYGLSSIPSNWLDILHRKDYLLEVGNKLYDIGAE